MKSIFKYIAVLATTAGLCGALARPAGAEPEMVIQPDIQPGIWDTAEGPDHITEPLDQQRAQPQGPDRATIAFTDPERPGSLEMDLVLGSITIKGTNRKDIAIEAHPVGDESPRRRNDEPVPPGLRRLTQSGDFSVEEEKNVVSIDVDSPVRSFDFVIEVPVRTNLHLETVKGWILVEGVDGDLEVDSVNGAVTLTNVGGSVVAHSVNGKLLATVMRIAPQKPMAFTSMNGSVDVTLPAAVKANLKLRSDQGDVYTDFDLQARGSASGSAASSAAASGDTGRRRNVRQQIDVDKAIYGSVNGGGPDFEMRTFNGNVYVRKGK
jgi:hypothetical protein